METAYATVPTDYLSRPPAGAIDSASALMVLPRQRRMPHQCASTGGRSGGWSAAGRRGSAAACRSAGRRRIRRAALRGRGDDVVAAAASGVVDLVEFVGGHGPAGVGQAARLGRPLERPDEVASARSGSVDEFLVV